MHRFFIPKQNFVNDEIIFPADIAHQITHVLRLSLGDQVIVLDNEGMQYKSKLINSDKQLLSGKIISKELAGGEPNVRLGLFISLTQREKFEWILQKGTEIGVSDFVPFVSKRSLVNQNKFENKSDRWKAIIREAAEQCGRARTPQLRHPDKFNDALEYAHSEFKNILVAWETTNPSEKLSIGELNENDKKIALFIGPEGGFSYEEMQSATDSGAKLFSLGNRILRMETAAIVAATLVLHAVGEF